MKKFMKALALILVMALMMTAVVGCTNDEDEDEDIDSGTSQGSDKSEYSQYDGDVYVGSYEYNGSEMEITIVLHEDSTYRKITIKDKETLSDISGDYEWVDDDELRLYENSSSWWTYTHNNGVLKNNNHEFKKVK